ncbi:hypothetical protein SLEP1_g46988 [Rubroshorea leprosula]|uniref:PiggyBac transposable element-derived protein domain-containing protein n=1 Tax=Rubroshorea leprosula TaxID=152421 RepID=A0AAV5LPX0_9ROSI|nr:hypothetical protein SLEP1_g46988 [Rubroshorea leprosula]
MVEVVEASQEKTTAGEQDKLLAATELDQNPPLVTPIAKDDFFISCAIAEDESVEPATIDEHNFPAHKLFGKMPKRAARYKQLDELLKFPLGEFSKHFGTLVFVVTELVTMSQKRKVNEYWEPLALLFPNRGISEKQTP